MGGGEGGGEGGGGEGGGCGGGCGGLMGGRRCMSSLLGRRQTSGLHTTTRLLGPQPLVHVKKKRHTESAAYTAWWWLTTYENLVSMFPHPEEQLMVSTVIQSPALETRTCRSTV